jgi:glucan phosphorylase
MAQKIARKSKFKKQPISNDPITKFTNGLKEVTKTIKVMKELAPSADTDQQVWTHLKKKLSSTLANAQKQIALM